MLWCSSGSSLTNRWTERKGIFVVASSHSRSAGVFAERAPVQFFGMKQLAKVSAICWSVLGWIVLGAALWVAAEPIASLRPMNYVNDFAGVLDSATQASLNDLCQQVDQKAHAQIAVVTVKTLDGQDVVSYAVALYQKWGIGAKGKDRGVLILLAAQDHKYWTTVGYGLVPIGILVLVFIVIPILRAIFRGGGPGRRGGGSGFWSGLLWGMLLNNMG